MSFSYSRRPHNLAWNEPLAGVHCRDKLDAVPLHEITKQKGKLAKFVSMDADISPVRFVFNEYDISFSD